MDMIKKIMAEMIIIFLLAGFAYAEDEDIDKECTDYGFDSGIAKFYCDSIMAKVGDGTTISVTWTNCDSSGWTANPAASGIISNEGGVSYVNTGGILGTVSKKGQDDIDSITFCRGGHLLPEYPSNLFPFLAAFAAIGISVVLVKKK